MTQIPLLQGVKASEQSGFDTQYPINLEPVVIDSGISKGYLRFPPGVQTLGDAPGLDRGGIEWNGVCYRVMGAYLVRIAQDGSYEQLGYVGDDGRPVSLDYSFDYLSIGSARKLFYYYNGGEFEQVADSDLGAVIDHVFIAGYNMTTDGESLVVTELNDPLSVDPLKYGASESDPDPITGLAVLRNEVYAFNRYTIDVFRNVGGNGFPFAAIPGAIVPRGCVSRSAKCHVGESIVMVGSARGEALGVYQVGAGQTVKLSTREIDGLLAEVADPDAIIAECLTYGDQMRVMFHLPDQTLVFLPESSNATRERVWYIRQGANGIYRPRFFTLAYGEWLCGDASEAQIGRLDETLTTDFGDVRPWQLQTQFLYNESRGAIVHSLELVGLPGRVPFNGSGVTFFSFSRDGETWSEERAVSTGGVGQRGQRVQLRPHFRMSNYLAIRCRGNDLAHAGWARLEAQLEGLAV